MWNTRDVFVGKCPSSTGGKLKNAHSHEIGMFILKKKQRISGFDRKQISYDSCFA